MTKLNWSCTFCGRTFSRRSSAQRHIDNYNIHQGLGQAVPYAEYSMGIREGKYWPQTVPQFTRAETPYLKKIEVEVENQIIREIATRIYNQLTESQLSLNNLETFVSDYLASKNFNDIFKGANL